MLINSPEESVRAPHSPNPVSVAWACSQGPLAQPTGPEVRLGYREPETQDALCRGAPDHRDFPQRLHFLLPSALAHQLECQGF